MSGAEEQALAQARAAHAAHGEALLGKANVVGVGVGRRQRRGVETDEVALVVLVTRKQPLAALAPDDRIPRRLEGVPVDVREVGDLQAGF